MNPQTLEVIKLINQTRLNKTALVCVNISTGLDNNVGFHPAIACCKMSYGKVFLVGLQSYVRRMKNKVDSGLISEKDFKYYCKHRTSGVNPTDVKFYSNIKSAKNYLARLIEKEITYL